MTVTWHPGARSACRCDAPAGEITVVAPEQNTAEEQLADVASSADISRAEMDYVH